jgi:hypothetical protein
MVRAGARWAKTARRAGIGLLVAVCAAAVIGFQATRPTKAVASAQVFVPSPRFYTDFSPSFRTTIADAYWLLVVQYYGEHISGDHKLGSLAGMLDLVTTLSPRFKQPYLFGAFALVDAGQTQKGYELLLSGAKALPNDWNLDTTLGAFIYEYANNEDKARLAAVWYERAAKLPGRPDWVPRVAAELLAKGGEAQKAALLWAQIYSSGDRYSRQKAVAALNQILPKGKVAREKAVALLAPVMTPVAFNDLIVELFKGY